MILILCPVDPCTCAWCTRRCTTPGVCACVRPTSNACTVGPERPPPATSPVPPQSYTTATRSTCGCERSPKRAGDSDGHYYCIVEDGGEGKEKRKGGAQWVKALTEPATESCRAGFDAGGFRVKVNSRDSARTQGNTPVHQTDFLTELIKHCQRHNGPRN